VTTCETKASALDRASAHGFRAFFVANFDFVCKTLRRLGVIDADLADVAQEVFVVAHRSFSTYDPERSAKTWLFAFARGYASNYRRLGWHRRAEMPDSARASSQRLLQKLDARAKVALGLAALDDEKTTVLVLHDMEGLSAAEIARDLGVPLNTVYTRIRAAREAFKMALAEEAL